MKYSKQKGFTMVELLVVVSIIAMLSSVVLAAVQSARDKGRIGAAQRFASTNYHAVGVNTLVNFNFDETNATDVPQDSSGNGITLVKGGTGTIDRTTVGDSFSGQGRALRFNSTSYYFDVPNSFDSTDPFLFTEGTISVWMKSSSGNTTSIYSRLYPGKSFMLLDVGGTLRLFKINNGVWSSSAILSSRNINDGKWHNIVYSAQNGTNAKIYLDGTMVLSGATVGYAPTGTDTTADCTLFGDVSTSLGARVDTDCTSRTYPTVNMQMDDFVIYTQYLGESDVKQIYAQGLRKHGIVMND